ncbi:MAG: GtrA family protein [Fibrobacter sp.]|nr:GtrA family protein [Fibrobacter sp.]
MRYLVTGGVAFVVDFGLFALFLYVFDWHYLLANLMGLLGGLAVNYYISVVWVFSTCKRNVKSKGAEILIFALIGFAGVGINQLLMYLMVDYMHVMEMASKMIAAVIVLMWNFGVRKALLFRGKKI